MMYDALQKRSAYLDALARGLNILGVKTLMNMFSEECKQAFVWDGRVRACEVASMMSPVPSTLVLMTCGQPKRRCGSFS